jgi:hypothetical protein
MRRVICLREGDTGKSLGKASPYAQRIDLCDLRGYPFVVSVASDHALQ